MNPDSLALLPVAWFHVERTCGPAGAEHLRTCGPADENLRAKPADLRTKTCGRKKDKKLIEQSADSYMLLSMETAEHEFPMPLIHLNGNSRETLTEQYEKAVISLFAARDEFNQIDFHPRDYYPLDDDPYSNESFNEALTERLKILEAFTTIQNYLEKHLAHLAPLHE